MAAVHEEASPPQDDDRNDIDKHRDDDGDEDENHRGAVEMNSGDSDRYDCYLAPFHNTTIWYVVTAMV